MFVFFARCTLVPGITHGASLHPFSLSFFVRFQHAPRFVQFFVAYYYVFFPAQFQPVIFWWLRNFFEGPHGIATGLAPPQPSSHRYNKIYHRSGPEKKKKNTDKKNKLRFIPRGGRSLASHAQRLCVFFLYLDSLVNGEANLCDTDGASQDFSEMRKKGTPPPPAPPHLTLNAHGRSALPSFSKRVATLFRFFYPTFTFVLLPLMSAAISLADACARA